MSSTPQKRDRLSNLIPELLIKIIAELPLRFFLDLKHTSRFFRGIFLRNASTICNYAIESRYPYQAKLLNSTRVSSWLVPAHPKITFLEQEWQSIVAEHSRMDKYLSLLGELKAGQGLPLKVTSLGPQYLRFLEYEMVWKEGERHCAFYLLQQPEPDGLLVDEQKFRIMLDGYNNKLVDEEKISKAELMRFPRELIWYYGVEGLKAEEKCWPRVLDLSLQYDPDDDGH